MTLDTLFSNGLILIGAGFMLTSILLSLKMLIGLPDLVRKRWIVLTGFMGFFLIGYLGFIVVSLSKIPLPVELITGSVFLGGAFFVFLVIRLTRKTVDEILDKENQLKEANQHLEQRVAERTLDLQHAMDDLDAMHGEIDQILNTISTGVRLIDQDRTVVRVNATFCTMTGLSAEELVGSKCFSHFRNESCEQSDDCALRQIFRTGKAIREDCIKIRQDNEQRHYTITSTPYRNNEGELVGIVEDFLDITKRTEMEQEREQMQTQLLQQSKLESVGQLAAGMAHEINTPIQYIGTNIDFFSESFDDISTLMSTVEKECEEAGGNALTVDQVSAVRRAMEEADWEFLSEEVPAALQQTRDGVNRVSAIVRAMKEFSHPGSKEMAPANLNDIINNTLTISANEWKYVAEIETDFSRDFPMVPCLSEEMGQVFLNIIVNGAHAIAEQQKQCGNDDKGTITLSTDTEQDFAVIRISDSGSGMPEEVRKRIFDPFFTTKEVGNGTGQGLSIAQDVVTIKHHGSITVDSEPGKGTTFTIRLPLREDKGAGTNE